MKKLQFCLVMLSLLVLAVGVAAQVTNGQFTGTVTDPSGAAIAGAKVAVTNLGTNLSVTTTTTDTGSYTVRELPPGSYKIAVEAKGFKTSTNPGLTLNAGTTARVDFKMQLGEAREVVEVTGEAAAVNTEDSKLAGTVNSTQIANLPLNGRNVYDLIQMAPGAVSVTGVDFENGHGTVVNGLREDFNGFLINGVSNKGLSGGVVNTPIQDTVQEFQQLQLNMSAQYGNSAGSINNLVTKSGTNAYHGSLWEYLRNDAMDANTYFLNRPGTDPITGGGFKPPLRFNQFGGTVGGPIIKDKLFFFASYQGDRFKTTGTPSSTTEESPQWRSAVIAAAPNSVAALLYQNFQPRLSGNLSATLDQFVTGGSSPSGLVGFPQFLCSNFTSAAIANRFASIMGVTAQDIATMSDPFFLGQDSNGNPLGPCSSIPAQQAGTMSRSAPFELNSVAIFGSQVQSIGNLFNGNEASGRIDYNWNASNRLFLQFNWLKSTDQFGPCNAACTRGFGNPSRNIYPAGMFSFVHTFSPTILNEFRAGYTQNNTAVDVGVPGVPDVEFGDGSAGFGSYNGYPQFFKEHIYTYSDMVSVSHGNHNMKVGADFRRNIENSVFSVARPSYYMFDPLFFAVDAPAEEVGGVNPGICAPPCSSFNPNPQAQLESNVRHWRNLEVGAYFQDDWKVSKRLTLNLGLRWDLFTRHHELDNLATTFLPGQGSNILDGIINANTFCPGDPLAQLAGECGPGGFAPAKGLGKGDHNNWGPRVGFAYDVFGDGKTSLRGGFGLSYEGTLYNPLSNSRWNLPYYSFNFADNFLFGDVNYVMYGPTTCTATTCQPDPTATPTFTGPATNPGQGIGAQATGNLTGWAPFNPNVAILTGIVLPEGIRDPYVYNYFLGVQREIVPRLVTEINYVGTTGHKLFRAENINRHPGSVLPVPTGDPGDTAPGCITDNFGRNWCGNGGFANNNYGNLRNWRNVVNSNYNSLQASVKKQMSHGLLFNASYTYSHTIDEGSTWHSGATSANGAGAGEGYTTDLTLPGLDRGNSIFDIRHRLVFNYVWELPGKDLHGFLGVLLGGWSYNGIWSFQSGAHWEPYRASAARLREISDSSTSCTAADVNTGNCQNLGGDYNLDHGRNDRPNSTILNIVPSRTQWSQGWGDISSIFSTPCLGCVSNLGRNTFVGPGAWFADMTLGKVFKFTERVNLKFEAQAFNVFNRANFLLATEGGGAHNKITDSAFGQAEGTLNARNLQVGLKLSF